MKPARRMPPRNETDKPIEKSSSDDNVSDDGFSNLSTPRVTMAGWSAGNDGGADSPGADCPEIEILFTLWHLG